MNQIETEGNSNRDCFEDPYELIVKLRNVIKQQKRQLQDYQVTCRSYQSSNTCVLKHNIQKQRVVQELGKQLQKESAIRKETQLQLDQIRVKLKSMQYKGQLTRAKMTPISGNLLNSRLQKTQRLQPKELSISWIPELKHIESKVFSQQKVLEQKNIDQYVPEVVKLTRRANDHFSVTPSIFNQTFYQNGPLQPGETFIQDFCIVGPDAAQFRKIRDANRTKKELKVKADIVHNINKIYKTKKPEFITEIARRAFPEGIQMKKRMIENVQQIRETLQYKPQKSVGQEYFVFTLKGDQEMQDKSKGYFSNANPNNFLFIICLKLPDFISIRDEKHYQRREHEVWLTEKVYAFATYYPFIPIFVSLLEKIESIIYSNKIHKIMAENDNFLIWQFSRNIFDIQKNQSIRQIIGHFVNKRPDYGQVCYSNDHYFGTMPEYGFNTNYAIARSCCPIFFSTFAYEETLLLITALFCEKTLVFLSKQESVATMCGLFIVSVIYPFLFSSPLLLNCDSQKIENMIFQFPFALVASIKRTPDNINEIVGQFAKSNILRFKGSDDTAQYILIDVDSNTILYDSVLTNLFEEVVFSPSEELHKQYLKVNQCNSKSFSLPKTMPRQVYKSREKPKSGSEKDEEEKRKVVKEYIQMLDNNSCKTPTYRLTEQHEIVLKMLVEFINSLAVQKDSLSDFLEFSQQNREKFVRNHLLEKYRGKHKFIDILIKSQLYANYMDSISKQK